MSRPATLPTTAEVHARIVRSQLTIGLAGGWVLFVAGMVHLLVTSLLFAMLVDADLWHAHGDDILGFFEALAIITWVVGWVLAIIGCFALAQLDRTKRPMAWVMAAAYVAGIGGTVVTAEAMHGDVELFAHGLLALVIAFYGTHAIVWLRHRSERGLARSAATASLATIVCVIVAYVGLDRRDDFGVPDHVSLFALILGPAVASLSHLAAGLAMGRARAEVGALTGFD